ncbi:hypothetical protein U91I_02271 [alpha proteobacterium U9-1i]|nr:hypothetical protein U91I_02271 [alpha proteobacterium U9-1i]
MPKSAPRDLIEAAANEGGFETFVALSDLAGLSGVLKGAARHTVFAPTNQAFNAMAPGALEDLGRPERRDALLALLKLHIVAGKVRLDRFTGRRMHGKSIGGAALSIDGVDGVQINGARVVRPDIAAANGMLHGIDSVLTPKIAARAVRG